MYEDNDVEAPVVGDVYYFSSGSEILGYTEEVFLTFKVIERDDMEQVDSNGIIRGLAIRKYIPTEHERSIKFQCRDLIWSGRYDVSSYRHLFTARSIKITKLAEEVLDDGI